MDWYDFALGALVGLILGLEITRRCFRDCVAALDGKAAIEALRKELDEMDG